jgi:hypothetical protein
VTDTLGHPTVSTTKTWMPRPASRPTSRASSLTVDHCPPVSFVGWSQLKASLELQRSAARIQHNEGPARAVALRHIQTTRRALGFETRPRGWVTVVDDGDGARGGAGLDEGDGAGIRGA